MNSLIDQVLLERIGVALLHSLWEGALIGALAWFVLTVIKPVKAHTRYGIACVALFVIATAPVATFIFLAPPEHTSARPLAAQSIDWRDIHEDIAAGFSLPEQSAPVVDAQQQRNFEGSDIQSFLRQHLPMAAFWAAIFWFIGAQLQLLRLLGGHAYWRIACRLADHAPVQIQIMTRRLCEQFKCRPVALLISTRVMTPMVVGWLKPIILAPPSLVAGISPDLLEALLAHELAHLRRWDHIVNMLQCLVEVWLFYHPVVWWLSRRIRVEREYCCDDAVLLVGGDPARYAESLLTLMENMTGGPSLAVMSNGGSVVNRVRRILGARPIKTASLKSSTIGGLVAGLLISASLIGWGWYQVSFAAQNVELNQELSGISGTLLFPEESVGEVRIRPKDVDYWQDAWQPGHELNWDFFAEARGEVEIPAGHEVMIKVKTHDLSFLFNLAADSVDRLDCGGLNLTDGEIEPVGYLSGLRSLDLNNNKRLTDAGLSVLENLSSLEWLDLNVTSAGDCPFLLGLNRLQYLDAYKSQFSDNALANLAAAQPQGLAWLGLERTRVSSNGLALLGAIPSIRGMTLMSLGLTDACLKHVAQLKNLEYLLLTDNNITGNGVKAFSQLLNLRHLMLGINPITDSDADVFVRLPSLERLELFRTNVTMKAVQTLEQSPTLWYLIVSETVVPYKEQLAFMQRNAYKRPAIKLDSVEPQMSTNPNAPRVGLYFSHFTATGPHWMPEPYGFDFNTAKEIFDIMNAANYDIYAVVEPQTEQLGDLPQILARLGLDQKLIYATDVNALSKMDTIFAYRTQDIPDDVFQAFKTAIRGGVGIVSLRGMGNVSPGLESPELREFFGFRDCDYRWAPNGSMEFKIYNSHPILGVLKPGMDFHVPDYNGMFDPNNAPDDFPLIGPAENSKWNFYPLLVRQYGKGRTVTCFWLGLEGSPDWPWPYDEFYRRSINWAAGEPVDTKW